MTLSTDQLQEIARLAGLDVQDDQLDQMAEDVTRILSLVSAIQQHGSGAEPYRPGPAASPLRPDTPDPDRAVGNLETIAPEFKEGFVLAPKPPGVDTG